MKKISPIYILTVVSIASILAIVSLLVYTRGGGGGLDPEADSSPKIESVSIPKPAAMPQICTDDQQLDPLWNASQSFQQKTTTCTVDFPNLQVNSYCLNKTKKLGGVTIVIPEGTSEYINLPKNCSVVTNEESLHANKIVCYGPAGSKVNITLQNSCTPPDANLPAVVDGSSCPPDFVMNKYGGCEYRPSPNTPFCPSNYVYDHTSQCCTDAGRFVNAISVCPEGYLKFATWKPGVEEHTYVPAVSCVRKSSLDNTTTTRNYSIVLGSCGVTDNNNIDQFSPCMIDPATGACK